MILKGLGIILMLIHHLFYSPASLELYDDIIVHGVGVVNRIGIFSKLCVSIFVFVSGYGLAISTPEIIKLKHFYWHRFKKLYLNYWFIWLLFVPISVFIYGRSFTDAYGDHVVMKGFLDFWGLLKMFGYDSYNPTWWFYSCIILLYLLFPLLNKYLLSYSYFILSIALSLLIVEFVPGVNVIAVYLLPFLTGMFLAKMPVHWIQSIKIKHLFISIFFLSIWRLNGWCPKYIIDSMLCIGLAILLYKVSIWKCLSIIMEELH